MKKLSFSNALFNELLVSFVDYFYSSNGYQDHLSLLFYCQQKFLKDFDIYVWNKRVVEERKNRGKEDKSMVKVIACVNQKGGVAKTTSVLNISSCLVEQGKKVLMMDLDSQANLTKSIRVKEERKKTIYNAFIGEIDIREAIYHTIQEGLDIVSSSIELANLEGQLANIADKEVFLKEMLTDVINYDYILIDCSPTLNFLTVNALVAANSILIPLEPSIYSIEGLTQLIKIIKLVQNKFNSELGVLGVLLTRVDSRSSISQVFRNQLKDIFGEKLFETMVHQNINVVKSQISAEPLSIYNRLCRPSVEYQEIAQEVIKRNG